MRRRNSHLRPASVERDLARLADGTLDPSQRDRVERMVADSDELQDRLREQRLAVDATRGIVERERAPLTLRMHRQTLTARPRRRGPLFTVGALATAGALLWTVAVLGGSPAGLTVAEAAGLAGRPATAPVIKPPDDQVTLPGLRAAGLPFPYWEDHFGWHATGTRTDRMDGHALTTVFYRRGAQHIAYTIVAGDRLPPVTDAHIAVRAGTLLTISTTAGRTVVTWLRQGHTCVLSARDVPLDALVKLATWRGQGRIPY
jgi:hypothetical protein